MGLSGFYNITLFSLAYLLAKPATWEKWLGVPRVSSGQLVLATLVWLAQLTGKGGSVISAQVKSAFTTAPS